MKLPDKIKTAQRRNIIPFIPDEKFYFKKGVEAFENHKYDIAIKWLKKAVDSSPDNPLYQCQLAAVYTETGAYQASNQLLKKVLYATYGTYFDSYYLLANNYAYLGQIQDAKKYAEIYLEYTTIGEFRDDAEHLLSLLNNDVTEDDDWNFTQEEELFLYKQAVYGHMENEDWEEALPLLEDMLKSFPESTVIEHDYAFVEFCLGYENEAIELEQRIIEEYPESLNAHLNLALFYYRINEPEKAEQHTFPLLNVYPIDNEQNLRIAVVLAKLGIYEQSCLCFKRLFNSPLQYHLLYYKWYSTASYHIGQTSKAISLWEEGCRKYPQLVYDNQPWD